MGRVALRQGHDRFPAGVGLEPEQAPTIGIFCLVDEVHLRPDNVARLGHTFCWNIIVRVQDIPMPREPPGAGWSRLEAKEGYIRGTLDLDG